MVAASDMRVMRPFENLAEIPVSVDQVRGDAEQLEIVGAEGTRLIGERERRIGVSPRPAAKRLATVCDRIEHDAAIDRTGLAAVPEIQSNVGAGTRDGGVFCARLRARGPGARVSSSSAA